MTTPWLPKSFVCPQRIDMSLPGYHLRPIHADDTEIDMIAVMGSRERLWSIYGEAWGWPDTTLTHESDREDLARHNDEMTRNESFNFALLDDAETALLGCVYIDPPERAGGADAEISWWVIDEHVDSPVGAALDAFVPKWVADEWPLSTPRYVGIDLTWAEWLALDEI